jgi:hypothetical protein
MNISQVNGMRVILLLIVCAFVCSANIASAHMGMSEEAAACRDKFRNVKDSKTREDLFHECLKSIPPVKGESGK